MTALGTRLVIAGRRLNLTIMGPSLFAAAVPNFGSCKMGELSAQP